MQVVKSSDLESKLLTTRNKFFGVNSICMISLLHLIAAKKKQIERGPLVREIKTKGTGYPRHDVLYESQHENTCCDIYVQYKIIDLTL